MLSSKQNLKLSANIVYLFDVFSVGCSGVEFQCANGKCIPDYLRCNRRSDCEDGSDEFNCGTESPVVTTPGFSCPYGQQACKTGNQCFPYSAFCDGRFDCNDFSDESHCGKYYSLSNLHIGHSQLASVGAI